MERYGIENPREDGFWPKKILEYQTCENNLIIKVKNYNPSKGEKGHLKGEKGRQW